tara:strand:- start:5244 stop:5627 length:384 start_codon:yes stop_codon:yes gene_type:complete
MTDYDNNMKGYLWHESDSKVLRKGTMTIDNKKYYTAIVESTNNEGKKKLECLVSVGLLHINAPEDKRNPQGPDISGPITFQDSGKKYQFKGWRQMSKKNGSEYTSVSITEKDAVPETTPQTESTSKF